MEALGERVDGLGADAVQTYGLLEGLVVELASRVQYAGGLDDGVERDAAAEVAHGDFVVLDIDQDLLAEAHGVLVDGVVHDLLEQDIDAVTFLASVAEAADVHAGTKPDVLDSFDGFYVVVGIVGNGSTSHSVLSAKFSQIYKNYWIVPAICRDMTGLKGEFVKRFSAMMFSPLGMPLVSSSTTILPFFPGAVFSISFTFTLLQSASSL